MTVLYLDAPGAKSLPDPSILRVAGLPDSVQVVPSPEGALRVVNSSESLTALVTNLEVPDLLRVVREKRPHTKIVLVTDHVMEAYSKKLDGQEDKLLDHIIANRYPADRTINEFRVTLQKLIKQDLFGIDKYLAPGSPIYQLPVRGTSDREPYNHQVMAFSDQNRLGQYIGRLIFGITEELLMNAIYDAPVAGGRTHYADLPRTDAICLKPDEYSQLSYGTDGQVFAVGVRDPFGALKRNTLFQYLKKVLRRDDSANLIDTKKGGAGLGLFKILYSSHALVVNVDPQASTEVIALIDLQHQVRDFTKMTRSIHYFSTKQF